MGRAESRGLMGTPRVGELHLPTPHPGDMCSAQEHQQPAEPAEQRAADTDRAQ